MNETPATSPDAFPRPQLRRSRWTSLNGIWDFALDRDARWHTPTEVVWDARIRVPYSPETPASGIADTSFYAACWYRRRFAVPALAPGERLLLHFGAVDYAATVWVNGRMAVRHEGGYTPFNVDITELLSPSGDQTVIVHAEDDPHDLTKPRGKQDWFLEPHAIWYPRTTGIWQTVWIEYLPATAIDVVRWTASLERWEIGLDAIVEGERRDDLWLHVRLQTEGQLLADDTYRVILGQVARRIALSDPGVDDYRNELLWSPSNPTLIQAQFDLQDGGGEVIDSVESYTALRSVELQGDQFLLNERPYHLRMVLDQGYWPESGLTAPDDDALRRDVELAKAMGFNGVRKHQKIEEPRYLYWADRLGLLVWEEMPSAYRFTRRSTTRVSREWREAMDRDYSHPCIIAWVPLNESSGVPDLPAVRAQQNFVAALYYLTKTVDPDRPVIGNDGWESTTTDIIGIHDYGGPEKLAERYDSDERLPNLFKREGPGGRLLALTGHPYMGQPIVLTEFGGITLAEDPARAWGYIRVASASEFADYYARLLEAVRASPMLAGFCYTQFADTYQEIDGLLYADRTPKIPLEVIASATAGARAGAAEPPQALPRRPNTHSEAGEAEGLGTQGS